MEITGDNKRVLSVVGFAFLAMSVGITFARFWLGNVIEAGQWTDFLISLTSTYGIGMPLFIIVLNLLPDSGHVRKKEPISPGILVLIFFSFFGLTMLANVGMQVVIGGVGLILPTNAPEADVTQVGINAILAGLFGAAMAGFGEELVARKLLYKKMAGCPDVVYVLVSGVLFGILHTGFVQGIYASVLGMMLAYIYLKTRSFLLVGLIHMFVDLVSLFVPPLIKTYLGDAISESILTNVLLVIASVVLLYVLIRYNKKLIGMIRSQLQPAIGQGWEFIAKKPFRTMFRSLGVAIFTAWAVANMVRNLFF